MAQEAEGRVRRTRSAGSEPGAVSLEDPPEELASHYFCKEFGPGPPLNSSTLLSQH